MTFFKEKWPQSLLRFIIASLVLYYPFNLFAFTTNHAADIVIGQPDMSSNTSNSGGISSRTINFPRGLFSTGEKLFVSDCYNHRILNFNPAPLVNYQAADVVIGQADMTQNAINQGGQVNAGTLSYPTSVFIDGERLFIADPGNSRVLIYNHIPQNDNPSADIVVGQPTMVTNSTQNEIVDAMGLNQPNDVISDGNRMYIADYGNNRVLIYNCIPSTNGVNADLVIGQPNLLTNTANNNGLNGNTLDTPGMLFSDGKRLFISDQKNSRVLIFNQIPTGNNSSADIVVGQDNMTSNAINQGIGTSANTLALSGSSFYTGSRIFITDILNNRLLEYPFLPTANNAAAAIAIGQPGLTGNLANNGGVGPRSLNLPWHMFKDKSRLYVSDTYNNRVLIYESPLYLNSIYPSGALSGAVVGVTITGSDFDTTVKLRLTSVYGSIEPTGLRINDEHSLYATFNLQVLPGRYDVSVEKGDDNVFLRQGFLVQESLAQPAQWSVLDMGRAGNLPGAAGVVDLKIGDGDGDLFQELYVANHDTKIYQFRKNAGWSIAALPDGVEYYTGLAFTDQNHDGRPELFSTAANQHLIAFLGGHWQKNDFLDAGSEMLSLATGDGNRDGRPEIYAACQDGIIYQFKIIQGAWDKTTVGSGADRMLALVLGDGNADGRPEIYGANADRHVYQCFYNGASWQQTSIATLPATLTSFTSADIDHDGRLEFYAATDQDKIYQIIYANGNWNSTEIGVTAGTVRKLVAADADNDGFQEIYSASNNGRVYQFKSVSGQWSANAIGQAPSALLALAAGDADNDYQNELYALGADNHVYQFKAFGNGVLTPAPDKQIKAFPSRFNPEKGEMTAIRWYQAESTGTTIRVYNLRGELVKILLDHVFNEKGRMHEVVWHGQNSNGSTVASGIYVIYIQAGEYQDYIKTAIIK